MDKQQEFALRTVEERDVRFIRLWFTDVLGTLKSVAIAPAELEAAFEEGLGFDGSAIEGMTRVSEDDMIVQPDPSTFQILPWRGGPQGTARMFCDILTPDGEPSLGDPRHVLKRALAKAKERQIPYQLEVMSGHTGTNGWEMQISREGVATSVLSLPLKYMHSPIEVLSLADMEQVAALLVAFTEGLGKEAARR